jgi:hypothetical protein
MNNKRELLEAYKGSAKNYIRKYIIPSLPQKDNIINFTSSIYNYLEGSKVRYIRKLKNYSSRGKIYNDGSLSFTVTDNEPALWAYMECLEQSVNSFEHYHDNSTFPIAFALRSEEKKEFDSKFCYGKKKRETNFSKARLKHCHIIDCSPRGLNLVDLNINSRMLRLMSPMNHFPFPAPKHYNMKGGDIGESKQFLNLVKHTLHNEYYKSTLEKEYFLNFLKASGDHLLFSPDVEDFNIEFSLKESSNHKENNKSIRDESDSFNQKKKTDLSLQKNLTNFNDTRNYFKIAENWYGRGMIIKVKFNRGRHQNYSFIYNHDGVYDNTINHLRNLNCWMNNNCYSSSTNIPGWAADYVKIINN